MGKSLEWKQNVVTQGVMIFRGGGKKILGGYKKTWVGKEIFMEGKEIIRGGGAKN